MSRKLNKDKDEAIEELILLILLMARILQTMKFAPLKRKRSTTGRTSSEATDVN